jgi:hypothetical protein
MWPADEAVERSAARGWCMAWAPSFWWIDSRKNGDAARSQPGGGAVILAVIIMFEVA